MQALTRWFSLGGIIILASALAYSRKQPKQDSTNLRFDCSKLSSAEAASDEGISLIQNYIT